MRTLTIMLNLFLIFKISKTFIFSFITRISTLSTINNDEVEFQNIIKTGKKIAQELKRDQVKCYLTPNKTLFNQKSLYSHQ